MKAPANIFFVFDLAKYVGGKEQPDRPIGDPDVQKSHDDADTGFIAKNVYLFVCRQRNSDRD